MFKINNNICFKKQYSLNERITESDRVKKKHPGQIPVICERSINAPNDCPFIDKVKYLVPRELTVGQFIYVIRKRLNLHSTKALFIFINGSIPPTSQSIGFIYDTKKDEDGFLYFTYSFENVFG
jgi:GABA(A) receptor-associated protein